MDDYNIIVLYTKFICSAFLETTNKPPTSAECPKKLSTPVLSTGYIVAITGLVLIVVFIAVVLIYIKRKRQTLKLAHILIEQF